MTVTNAASGTRVHEIAPGIHRISTPVPPTRPFPGASRSTSFSSSTTNRSSFTRAPGRCSRSCARRWPTSSVTSPGFAGCLRASPSIPRPEPSSRSWPRPRRAPSRSCTGAASGATGQRCSWRWPTRWGCEAGGATIPRNARAAGRWGGRWPAPPVRPYDSCAPLPARAGERDVRPPMPKRSNPPTASRRSPSGRDFAVVLESLQGDFHVFGEALQGSGTTSKPSNKTSKGSSKACSSFARKWTPALTGSKVKSAS